MSQVQSGILPEHCRAAIWIEANVKGDVNALRAGSKVFAEKLAAFQDQFPDAHLGAVVAFGHNTWRELSGGVGAQELKDFPPYGKGLAPSTQFDVLIHILSLRHDVNFSVASGRAGRLWRCAGREGRSTRFPLGRRTRSERLRGRHRKPAGEETRREVAVIKDGVDAGRQLCFRAALGA
ncbi:Probable deferrochelatase/peroxidase YfeX [Kluyvera cryocrescens]|uniref:Probable deferrochelatase/peroxidase YfeX n=1 Tax=Kluyvera cryocrescens TaxID=580 RepID=A0A485ATZ9_KLUCR|nr:Probable deferrochelatase/peroxidase YfeX [Kluyvera cryocrescens]